MDLLRLVQKTMSEEPDNMLLAGACTKQDGSFTVLPDPENKEWAVIVRAEDVVEGPFDVEVDLEQLSARKLQALKVRKGTHIVLRRHGEEKKIVLTPQEGREGLCAMANPPSKGTCCRLFLEFDCATGSYLGWCFGWWDCLFPGSKC